MGIEPIELQLRDKIGVAIPLERLSEVPDKIENLLRNRSDWQETLKEFRQKYICNNRSTIIFKNAIGISTTMVYCCLNRIYRATKCPSNCVRFWKY